MLMLTGVLVVSGLASLAGLPIDAFPDTSPVSVQINTFAPAGWTAARKPRSRFPSSK